MKRIAAITAALASVAFAVPLAANSVEATSISAAARMTSPGPITTLPAAPLAPGSRTISPSYFGVQGFGPGGTAERAAAGSVRVGDWWTMLETSRGQYRWIDLINLMARARARGISEMLLVLNNTPDWARGPNQSSDTTSPGGANPPAALADWSEFTATLATQLCTPAFRNSGVKFSVQVWNEGNLTTFWNGSPELLARMTAIAYSHFHAICPRVPVVGASTTMRIPAAYQQFYPRYLKALARETPRWPVDAISIHGYPPGSGTPADFSAYLATARADLSAAGAPRMPLWVTEVNYGLRGPRAIDAHHTITGATAAAWVARTYLEGIRHGVERIYWFEQSPSNPVLGIQMWIGRPALTAQRVLSSWLVNQTLRGCASTNSLERCRFSHGLANSSIYWTSGPTRYIVAPRGVTRACTVMGVCYRVHAGWILRVNEVAMQLNAA